MKTQGSKHGSPKDRGSADRYYGRRYEPHYYPSGTGKGIRIIEVLMTKEQVTAYKDGWDNEEDRKEW
jgi:hypothetical protein